MNTPIYYSDNFDNVGTGLIPSILILVYLHFLEHERIVTDSQGLAAGSFHIPENDFPGPHIGKLLLVGIAGHFRIEIGENSRTLIILRMIGIVDLKIFNGDPFRHITCVAKIMLTGIRSADQGGTGWSAACRHENAVADNEFSLPGTAIVGAQVNEAPSADGGVLHGKGPAANGIDSHVSQGRVADGGIGNSLVGIETGKGTMVIDKVLAVVGTQDSPIGGIIDIICLDAGHE